MLTQKEVHSLFSYNKNTGILRWKMRPAQRVHIGDEAGSLDANGYKLVSISGKRYSAHRLIWLYVRGEFPNEQIDHINGLRSDNRFSNLRAVTISQNSRNRQIPSNNSSGAIGVNFDKDSGKWRARIDIEEKRKCLGRFDCLEDAIKAREIAENKYGYHQNHGRCAT